VKRDRNGIGRIGEGSIGDKNCNVPIWLLSIAIQMKLRTIKTGIAAKHLKQHELTAPFELAYGGS
jgi:hypothetical protein